ncbi:MAG: lipopolysaccharide assembly protein LapB [Verrucomicrobiaceae bacterium]|nr:lipopolysaccharide assembly protein LapB [Verrucomicrobiaceae bacterium]
MASIWLFILVFTAIACGWLLGRFASGSSPLPGGAGKAYRDYFRGLNYLLNDRPDEAIETFLVTLEVSKETLETHIALGNLMRRKGDVERAIRIHHNLLARPQLPPLQLQRASLELARDYISAGLFDRAEQLLLDLVQGSEELRAISLRHLIEIYQAERDWTKAIETATRLMPRRNFFLSAPEPDPELDSAIAHFHCELAQAALEKNVFDGARAHLQQALIRDPKCTRASLLQGLLEYRAGDFQAGIDALQRIPQQNPALLPEALDTLRACYDSLGKRELMAPFLRQCLTQYPSTRLALAIAEELGHRDGPEAANQFLTEQMRARPTLRGLQHLIALQHDKVSSTEILQTLMQKLVLSKPAYQCVRCGFSGRQLHWQCPSCKHWNTVQPIVGSEGD